MVKMLTTYELARCLQLHPDTIRKMAREGIIPSMQIGRKLRFDQAAVVEALTKNGIGGSQRPEPATSAAGKEG
jgi:excisionase family DNA binding protein